MKIMAIDLGDVRTGVAFSDPLGLIAGRALTIEERNRARLLDRLVQESESEKPGRIVVGLPLNMNGSEGERAGLSRAFARELEARVSCPVVLWDERQSSISAGRILREAGKKREKQRARVDAVAASIILQNYLDYVRLSKEG